MTESNKILTKLTQDIEQNRDELILKAYLLKADTKDEIEKLEKKWGEFKQHSHQVKHETQKATDDIVAATKLLGEELIEGYKRIVRSL